MASQDQLDQERFDHEGGAVSSGRKFIYPLGEEGDDGVLITEQPVGRILDEDTDNGDTPVKGGLLLI
jgi:hypothetical protein